MAGPSPTSVLLRRCTLLHSYCTGTNWRLWRRSEPAQPGCTFANFRRNFESLYGRYFRFSFHNKVVFCFLVFVKKSYIFGYTARVRSIRFPSPGTTRVRIIARFPRITPHYPEITPCRGNSEKREVFVKIYAGMKIRLSMAV